MAHAGGVRCGVRLESHGAFGRQVCFRPDRGIGLAEKPGADAEAGNAIGPAHKNTLAIAVEKTLVSRWTGDLLNMKEAPKAKSRSVLVIDVGGTNVKLLGTGSGRALQDSLRSNHDCSEDGRDSEEKHQRLEI